MNKGSETRSARSRGRRHIGRVLWTFAATATLGATVHAQLAPNEQSARAMHLERFVVPEFPPFLRQAGVLQGTVVVALGPDANGRAEDILVLESSDSRFTDAALEAIREWRFRKPDPNDRLEAAVPVVRFLFTTGAVSMVPLVTAERSGVRRGIRADTPIELPNFSHLDAVPIVREAPPPQIPAAAGGVAAGGTVIVKYFVDRDGRVRLPRVVSAPDPILAAASLAAIQQWRYDVPRLDGKPVIVLERHSFHFTAARD